MSSLIFLKIKNEEKLKSFFGPCQRNFLFILGTLKIGKTLNFECLLAIFLRSKRKVFDNYKNIKFVSRVPVIF